MLADRRGTVMARAAGAKHLCVINRKRGFKDRGAVTVFANVGCQYVDRALARSAGAIMATNAVADNSRVIEDRRKPGACSVAVIALIVGRYVRRCFPGCLNTVVAARTTAGQ